MDNMKLWLLKAREDLDDKDNPFERWYSRTFGLVIRAESEMQARSIATKETDDETSSIKKRWPDVWKNPKYTTCVELLTDGEEGVIITDFALA